MEDVRKLKFTFHGYTIIFFFHPSLKVVPFCGVFLKELSDALDGTASIISLKKSSDNTDDSIEVQ